MGINMLNMTLNKIGRKEKHNSFQKVQLKASLPLSHEQKTLILKVPNIIIYQQLNYNIETRCQA